MIEILKLKTQDRKSIIFQDWLLDCAKRYTQFIEKSPSIVPKPSKIHILGRFRCQNSAKSAPRLSLFVSSAKAVVPKPHFGAGLGSKMHPKS